MTGTAVDRAMSMAAPVRDDDAEAFRPQPWILRNVRLMRGPTAFAVAGNACR
jgi:hypothetical protein